MSHRRPIHEIRLCMTRAAIWANESPLKDVCFNATVSRLFNDGGRRKDRSTFHRDQLPIVVKIKS